MSATEILTIINGALTGGLFLAGVKLVFHAGREAEKLQTVMRDVKEIRRALGMDGGK